MSRLRLLPVSFVFGKWHLPHPVHDVWWPVFLTVILQRALQCSNYLVQVCQAGKCLVVHQNNKALHLDVVIMQPCLYRISWTFYLWRISLRSHCADLWGLHHAFWYCDMPSYDSASCQRPRLFLPVRQQKVKVKLWGLSWMQPVFGSQLAPVTGDELLGSRTRWHSIDDFLLCKPLGMEAAPRGSRCIL